MDSQYRKHMGVPKGRYNETIKAVKEQLDAMQVQLDRIENKIQDLTR